MYSSYMTQLCGMSDCMAQQQESLPPRSEGSRINSDFRYKLFLKDYDIFQSEAAFQQHAASTNYSTHHHDLSVQFASEDASMRNLHALAAEKKEGITSEK